MTISAENSFMDDQMKHALLELGRMITTIDRYDPDCIGLSKEPLDTEKVIAAMEDISEKINETGV